MFALVKFNVLRLDGLGRNVPEEVYQAKVFALARYLQFALARACNGQRPVRGGGNFCYQVYRTERINGLGKPDDKHLLQFVPIHDLDRLGLIASKNEAPEVRESEDLLAVFKVAAYRSKPGATARIRFCYPVVKTPARRIKFGGTTKPALSRINYTIPENIS